MPPQRIILGGVPGVGKSALLAAVQARLSIPVLNMGTAMLTVAREDGFDGDRDALRNLPVAAQQALRRRVIASLPPAFVLDCHFSTFTDGDFRPSVPRELFEPNRLSHVAILDAPSEIVLQRRANREGRMDGPSSLVHIQRHTEHNLRVARELAAASGAILIQLDAQLAPPDLVNEFCRSVEQVPSGGL